MQQNVFPQDSFRTISYTKKEVPVSLESGQDKMMMLYTILIDDNSKTVSRKILLDEEGNYHDPEYKNKHLFERAKNYIQNVRMTEKKKE